MAKIIKVGSNNPTFTQNKSANLAKTSRVSNPFKNVDFEGNTLPFADVFVNFKAKQPSKLRMVASSVTGSMTKIKSNIAEPIVNFVNRVRAGVSSAWDYAKNTNFSDVPMIKGTSESLKNGVKAVNDVLNTPIHIPALDGISESMSNMRKGIAGRMEAAGKDILGLGEGIKSSWKSMVSKFEHKKYTAETPVVDLESEVEQ